MSKEQDNSVVKKIVRGAACVLQTDQFRPAEGWSVPNRLLSGRRAERRALTRRTYLSKIRP